jgi:hypothetical protein
MLRLAYGPLVIAARCADPAPLAWLREFLGVSFGVPSPSAPSNHVLTLAFGPLPADPLPFPHETECFSLDGNFVRYPARHGPGGSLDFRDEAEGIAFSVRGPDVEILARSDGPAARLAILRVVREIATAHALREGQLHLHASAVAVGERVVAFAGPRESGKTTLLLHALLGGGVRYVANDRLFVDLGGGLPVARGMPTIVSLREETVARFPALAQRLRASACARHRTLAEADAAAKPDWRPNLTPAQLLALAGAEPLGAGTLRAAVFPAIATDIERFEVRELDAREAAARLVEEGLFLATLPERPAAAFAAGTRPRDRATLERLCRKLAARITCFDVRLGPRAYEGKLLLDVILGGVR